MPAGSSRSPPCLTLHAWSQEKGPPPRHRMLPEPAARHQTLHPPQHLLQGSAHLAAAAPPPLLLLPLRRRLLPTPPPPRRHQPASSGWHAWAAEALWLLPPLPPVLVGLRLGKQPRLHLEFLLLLLLLSRVSVGQMHLQAVKAQAGAQAEDQQYVTRQTSSMQCSSQLPHRNATYYED